ncbi:MAG: D-alanine--D-alanine ligase [Chloroflexi bacterium]|nr:D-alanine--D-alanine ligase [Chloroflexota bacterium]
MSPGKVRVAVLFGGRSGEHEVSLLSARSVMSAMDPNKYEIYPIGITKQGRWLTTGDPMKLLSSDPGARALQGAVHTGSSASQLASLGKRDLVPGTWRTRFPDVDVVFPVLHGPFGEDGTVQGLLELADLPYVGAGVLGSALGLDKVAQKDVLSAHGLPVVDYLVIKRQRWQQAPADVIAEVNGRLRYPVFVKPANLGSSVGVSKVHEPTELAPALDRAARYDRKLLVEQGVNAREIECSVLGNDQPIASVPGEVVPSNEFYDYRAKYIDNASRFYIPADLDEDTVRLVQSYAVRAFLAIDCAGMARVDFFLDRDTGCVFINELNTIPGFTAISMYPKLWEASGLPYPQLIDRLVELAIERHRETRAVETCYQWETEE